MKAIVEYIDDQKLAWAPTTLKSEKARLRAVAEHLDGDPMNLWTALSTRGAYTRLTAWQRVTHFWMWCQEHGYAKEGANPYETFRTKNARQFKGAYKRKTPTITFDQARALCESLPDPAIRRRALTILGSGLRYAESGSVKADGTVVGKGSKIRTIYSPDVDGPEFTGTYFHFRKALATVGLKPHDLRKLFATRLVELGCNEHDLKELMGWQDIRMAQYYVSANKDRMRALVAKVHGGTNDEDANRQVS